MVNALINLSSLKELIESSACTTLSASHTAYGGFMLHACVDDGGPSSVDYTLATFTSSSPKIFKRAESLMKDAKTLGIYQVFFDFSNGEL